MKRLKTTSRQPAKVSPLVFCLGLILAGCQGESPVNENAAVQIEKARPGELTQRAFKRQEIGAFEEAIEILDRALERDPQFVPALYRMGSVYEEWDKREEAVAAYKKVLAVDPAHREARMGLGSVYSKSALNDLAVEEYKKVAEARPDDPEIHFKVALEYWYLQHIPQAAEYYRKVIAIDPAHLQAHLNLASVYERLKEWDRALEQIEAALDLGRKTGNSQAIAIAESKRTFFKGRMNMTEKDLIRKTEPPFE